MTGQDPRPDAIGQPAQNRSFSRPTVVAALAVGIAGISFASILVRLSTAPAVTLAFYRMFLAAALLWPAAMAAQGSRGFWLREHGLAMAASGVFLAAHFYTWNLSLRYTSVASSVVLVDMHPLFVLAADVFLFRENISRRHVAGVFLAVLGSMVVGAGDFALGGRAFWGDLLAVAGALFVSVYLLIGRRVRQVVPALPYAVVVYGTAALVLAAASLAEHVPLWPYSTRDVLVFLGLAVIPTIFGHTIFNWALAVVPASLVSVTILGEPVGATILAAVLLHEWPGASQLAGGALILYGLITAMHQPKPTLVTAQDLRGTGGSGHGKL